MATSDAEGGNAAATRTADMSTSTSPQMDKRLEPLEEFRSRAEGWMKEVTAQVARLASNFEHEDKKRQALEDRLSDIEERIRSLLTLTELVSLDKNPFAGGRSAPASPSPQEGRVNGQTQTQAPAPPTPDPETVPNPAQEGPAPTEGVEKTDDEQEEAPEAPFPAAGRPGVEVVPVTPDPAPARAPAAEAADGRPPADGADRPEKEGTGAENGPEEETVQAPDPERDASADLQKPETPAEEADAPEPPAQPETASSWSLPAPEKTPPRGPTLDHHPNDAQAEAEPPAPAPSHRHPPSDRQADQKTARRLLVVAWANLLAPAAEKIDIRRFTDFYVDARWVDEETAQLVNRLVQEIAPHVADPGRPDVRGLHEATVRLLFEHDPELATFDRIDEADPEPPTDKADEPSTRLDTT